MSTEWVPTTGYATHRHALLTAVLPCCFTPRPPWQPPGTALAGLAANPARDLGPRIAHAVLPISNKGPSEWHYGWVPVVADFAGGAVGGILFVGLKQMFDVPGGEAITVGQPPPG